MLIILAVLIAVVVIAASQMLKTADKASGKIEAGADAVFNRTDSAIGAVGKDIGETCISHEECESGNCDILSNRCSP